MGQAKEKSERKKGTLEERERERESSEKRNGERRER